MSILRSSPVGWLISHEDYFKETYKTVDESRKFQLNPDLFDIQTPYKVPKTSPNKSRKTGQGHHELAQVVQLVRELYSSFYEEHKDYFTTNQLNPLSEDNSRALDTSTRVYDQSGQQPLTDISGANSDTPTLQKINGSHYLFPQNCKFHCKDVRDLLSTLEEGLKYDLILLDPPWWNKYIRRKRKKSDHGYDMMYNNDLKSLPLESLLSDNGLIVVWCTNSSQHLTSLTSDILPKWGVQVVGKWYWVKVTTKGETVCQFSEPPRKQPFEQIFLGGMSTRKGVGNKVVVSVPSALHSHKPPLIELLRPYLPDNPQCLEIFARYLMPGWTSYGKEALRLQHECLYIENQEVTSCDN